MTRFTYIYDTYCGWSYGAAPVIEALLESGADVTVYHRHLFQGPNAHRLGDGFAESARRFDARIEQLTGQQFSQTYFDKVLGNPDEILESKLTAQAAALIHHQGGKAEIALANALQKQRYVDGVAAADADAVQAALKAAGVDRPLSDGAARAAELSAKAAQIQARFGLNTVPNLLRHDGDRTSIINIAGYYKQPTSITAIAA